MQERGTIADSREEPRFPGPEAALVNRVKRLASREADGQVRQGDVNFGPVEVPRIGFALLVGVPYGTPQPAGDDDGPLEPLAQEIEPVDEFLHGLGRRIAVGAAAATLELGWPEEPAHHDLNTPAA